MSAISLREVVRSTAKVRAPLLQGIDLELSRGAWVNLVGPSGSGKSTLLRLLNRLDEADSGEISLLGRPLAQWPVRELRRKVAYVFQEPVLLGTDVAAALGDAFRVWGLPPPPQAVLEEALAQVGLDPGLRGRACVGLSGGERQRVALARALLTQPEVLLLDEPTAGLDEQAALPLLRRIQDLCKAQGLTVLIANHRLAEVRHMGGEMVVLQAGKVAAQGAVAEVFANPPNAAVREFLQGYGELPEHGENTAGESKSGGKP